MKRIGLLVAGLLPLCAMAGEVVNSSAGPCVNGVRTVLTQEKQAFGLLPNASTSHKEACSNPGADFRAQQNSQAAASANAQAPSIEKRKLLICVGRASDIMSRDRIQIPDPQECMDIRKQHGIAEFPGKISGYSSKVEVACYYQASKVDDALRYYKSGKPKSSTIAALLPDRESIVYGAWVGDMVNSIYSDSRSIFSGSSLSIAAYQDSCNKEPRKYIPSGFVK